MALLDAEAIPPTPENFAVWYAYAAGNNPDLVRTIDILRSNSQAFTPERSAELFAKFVGHDSQREVVESVTREIGTALGEMITLLKDTGRDTGRFGDSLAAFEKTLDGDPNLGQIQQMVQAMVQQTRAMLDRNRSLDSELSASAEKMERMRQDLEETQREALTDGLTGIANRKCFDMTLRSAAADAMEADAPLSLLMVDIDHFKAFNDNHGHQVGDEVLKLVARILKQTIKGRDTAARYGGEEFGIVLPQTHLSDAVTLAESIRKQVATKRIVRRQTGEKLGNITLSLGAATYRPGETLVDFVARADAALYAAKRSGRNRTVSEDWRQPQAASASA
ncbi:MAG: diguanylate cyclase [Azospirillaceae bacterium]